MARRIRTLRRSTDGASAVEFALILPVLLLLLVGIVQFAFLFEQWLALEHAAREGVRWASLCNPSDQVKARAIASAPGVDLAVDDIDVTPADPVTAPTGSTATVTVRHSVPVFVPLMNEFLGDEVELTASASQLLEK